MLRRSMTVVAVGLALVVTACGSDSESETATGATTTTAEAAPVVEGLDFATGSAVELGDGWTISPCEAGPPLFCARRRGESAPQSVVELISVPASSYDAVKRTLDSGGSVGDALAAQAREYQATFAKDRPSGCGAGYRVAAFGPDRATIAGEPGVVYGFDGHQDGKHVERTLQFATIRGGTLHVIVTHAVDDGTCMDDGTYEEFTVGELTELQPAIVQMVAASTLP